MTQPDYVPILPSDRIRPSDRLPAPRPWVADRPADLARLEPPTGRRFGATGPDLGYGLKLAHRVAERIEVRPGESVEDATAGCFACGAKRAALFGRAPVIFDMEWAFTLWGFLGGAPDELLDYRSRLFRGAAHHYFEQRDIVDRVREHTFRMPPAEVRARLQWWKELIIDPDIATHPA